VVLAVHSILYMPSQRTRQAYGASRRYEPWSRVGLILVGRSSACRRIRGSGAARGDLALVPRGFPGGGLDRSRPLRGTTWPGVMRRLGESRSRASGSARRPWKQLADADGGDPRITPTPRLWWVYFVGGRPGGGGRTPSDDATRAESLPRTSPTTGPHGDVLGSYASSGLERAMGTPLTRSASP